MSVRWRPDRKKYEVRWKEGGQHRSRFITRHRDALSLEREIKRRQELGPLMGSVMQSRMTLTEFVREEWWPTYVVPNLRPSTRYVYAQIYAKHVNPRLVATNFASSRRPRSRTSAPSSMPPESAAPHRSRR